MTATMFGVIYSDVTMEVRRIYVPDADVELQNPTHTGPGESMRIIALPAVVNIYTLRQAILDTMPDLKVDPTRSAVVDPATMAVVNTIMAHPLVDEIPGYTLVASNTAQIGDTWDGQDTFTRPTVIP